MDLYPFFDFWRFDLHEILKRLNTQPEGLSSKQAHHRQKICKKDILQKTSFSKIYLLFLHQFQSPLSILLTVCAILAYFLSDSLDAWIILSIILISSLLGVLQEHKAQKALKSLLDLVDVKIVTWRDQLKVTLSQHELVPGDVIYVQAGDPIPADCVLLESHHLFVNEANLSGESQPVEKEVSSQATARNTNILWMGSFVMSGYGRALIANIGIHTNFGKMSYALKNGSKQTAFEKNVFHLGSLLIEITFMLVIVIFAINMLFQRDLLQSFLFSLALGVGLTPQLLPMILSVTLAKGAIFLAKKSMITKKLSALENLGSMDILCCDKTGTLTEGSMSLNAFCDIQGHLCEKTLLYAYLSAHFQAGCKNPFDQAILSKNCDIDSNWKKVDEIPFDFGRKRFSILLQNSQKSILITKGDFSTVLPLCTALEETDFGASDISQIFQNLSSLQKVCATKNIKLLAIAYKVFSEKTSFTQADEQQMTFLGYLEFLDPVKSTAKQELLNLKNLGIHIKIISGDHCALVEQVGKELDLDEKPLIGAEFEHLSQSALAAIVEQHSLFSEVNPLNKEKLIQAMQSHGYIVGFLGDGINDCAAMVKADVSISVDQGSSVAKQTADFVMMRHSLDVLKEGVICGRKTFANTLKYIFMATSANFGNMFSMAFSSLMLPFLPFLPKQILLINFLTDIPELTIATDHVDEQWLISPQKWDFRFIKKFMLVFGLLSSFFDFLTFFLLKFLHLSPAEFRTGWFIESVISAASVLLIIRTKKTILISRPSFYLTFFVGVIICITLAIPYTYLGGFFGFKPLPMYLVFLMLLIVALYVIAAEYTKKLFYKMQR